MTAVGATPAFARLIAPAALEQRARAGAEAVLDRWPTDPAGPVAGALTALPDRERADALAGGPLALAVVGSLDELTAPGGRPWRLPWTPSVDGRVETLLVLAGDAVAVVTGDGLSCEPAEAGAFESLAAVSVTVRPGAPVERWSLGAEVAFAARAVARVWVASVLVGVAQASLDDVTEYGTQRIVFGLPVLGHQANGFELAGRATQVEAARRALARAARRDAPSAFAWAGTQAYLEARQAALAATDLGVQLHGGHGYLQGKPTERYFREARLLTLLCGGSDAAVDDLTDRVLDPPDWAWP